MRYLLPALLACPFLFSFGCVAAVPEVGVHVLVDGGAGSGGAGGEGGFGGAIDVEDAGHDAAGGEAGEGGVGGQAGEGGAGGIAGMGGSGGEAGAGGAAGMGGVGGGEGGHEALQAVVALTEVPQAEAQSSTAAVSVAPPVVLEGGVGCAVVFVDPADSVAAPVSADAGRFTISGVNGGPLTFSHRADGRYLPDQAIPRDLFSDGAAIGAAAEGGPNFGAFSVEVNAPRALQVTAPRTQPPFGIADASHDRDLQVGWIAGDGDGMLISIFPINDDGEGLRGNWIFCGAADNGQFVVPGRDLMQVDTGSFGLVLVAVTRSRFTTVPVGMDSAQLSISTSFGVPTALH